MKVTVHYLAQLRRAAKTGTEEVEIDAPATLPSLLALLVQRHGEELSRLLLDGKGVLQSSLLVFINDEQAAQPEGTLLKDGDQITFLSPIAGG